MKYIAIIMAISLLSNPQEYDFGKDKINSGWQVVNDGVMGGLSRGVIDYQDNYLSFSGKLSLENNGGFSWAQYPIETISIKNKDSIQLKVKTDDRKYVFTCKTDTNSAYHYETQPFTTNGAWKTLTFHTTKMTKTFRGRSFGETLSDESQLSQFGVIIKDKKEGSFTLDLDLISM